MVSANSAEISSTSSSSCDEDENSESLPKHTKSRISFLDMHPVGSHGRDDENSERYDRDDKHSPSYSPNNNRKPMVPPLDLSILHEHMDSAGKSVIFNYVTYISFLMNCVFFLLFCLKKSLSKPNKFISIGCVNLHNLPLGFYNLNSFIYENGFDYLN